MKGESYTGLEIERYSVVKYLNNIIKKRERETKRAGIIKTDLETEQEERRILIVIDKGQGEMRKES